MTTAIGESFAQAGTMAPTSPPSPVIPAANPTRTVVPLATPTPFPMAAPPSLVSPAPLETSKPMTPAAVDPVAAMIAGITPPLSIYDSLVLLKETVNVLDKRTDLTAPVRGQLADRMAQAVINYVERVDRMHSTLPYYDWELVSAEKVPATGPATQTIKLRQPIDQVTALGLSVRHGDIIVQRLVAIDVNKTRWEFDPQMELVTDRPRPEIFSLPLPTRLVQVDVTSRRRDEQNPHRPRLTIEAGICSLPESGKEAIFYLQMARNHLKNLKTTEAAREIRKAFALLKEFQKSRRL